MSTRTVHLHNSRPRYDAMGGGSSYPRGSCHQHIFGSLANSTTFQPAPVMKNQIPTLVTPIPR